MYSNFVSNEIPNTELNITQQYDGRNLCLYDKNVLITTAWIFASLHTHVQHLFNFLYWQHPNLFFTTITPNNSFLPRLLSLRIFPSHYISLTLRSSLYPPLSLLFPCSLPFSSLPLPSSSDSSVTYLYLSSYLLTPRSFPFLQHYSYSFLTHS